jgi:GNAT superfamily N-acetyltransferase
MSHLAANVRAATEADIPAIIEMGRALHAESPRYSRMSFAAEKIDALARSLIVGTLVSDAPGGVLVAEKNGQIVGMMAGFVSAPFFSHDKIASDYTFYVKPEHRKTGRIALKLVRAFEAWAIAAGAADIVPGTSTEIDADSTRRFYEKLGYKHYGHAMIKRLKWD